MSIDHDRITRVPLLKTLKDLAKRGSRLEASIVTTYSLNAAFYEEVLLRAFERAGSRLNILMVDARQLAETVNDRFRRPLRAGRDYLLLPILDDGAFHPKILTLLSSDTSMLAIGSHNATDSGFSHNEEVTAVWEFGTRGAPSAILHETLDYCLKAIRESEALQDPLMSGLEARLLSIVGRTEPSEQSEVRFLASSYRSPPLWKQLIAQVQLPVRGIYLVGPYFDSELRFVRQIDKDLEPLEIVVGIQPGSAVLPSPENAPPSVRFVDSAVLGAFWPGDGGPGFAHGKAMALETAAGLVVVLGSANPTGAAWLSGGTRNSEANLLLLGDTAQRAFKALGFEHLQTASSLEPSLLSDVGSRSRELRRQEQEREASRSSIGVLVGISVDEGLFIPRLNADECHGATLLHTDVTPFEKIAFESAENGALMRTSPPPPSDGLIQIEGSDGPVCLVVINSEPNLRRAMQSKEAVRLLDTLGRLDDYEGFDELFDLFDRHIFGTARDHDTGPSPTTSRHAEGNGDEGPEKIGPRGISLLTLGPRNERRRTLEGGLVADFISALLRDLAPPPRPSLDGDAPNRDAEDTSDGELAGEEIAGVQEQEATAVDWPRIVTACRKRVGHLLTRLRAKIEEHKSTAERAPWLFVRILTVLCLLRRLRNQSPPQDIPARRPDSLVSTSQLRDAFKLAMDAVYGSCRLAMKLESSPDHRAARERGSMDEVLLWLAQEIGADLDAKATFNETEEAKLQRQHDQADLILVAMAAAAHVDPQDSPIRPAVLARWSDAVQVRSDWIRRHLGLGRALQRSLALSTPITTGNRPKSGDFAIWKPEPGLPRLVISVSGKKAYLLEPGIIKDRKPVGLDWLSVLDLPNIPAI